MSNVIQRKTHYTQNHMSAEMKDLDPEYYSEYGTVYDKAGGRAMERFDAKSLYKFALMQSTNISEEMAEKKCDALKPAQIKEFLYSMPKEDFDKLIEKYGRESGVSKKATHDRKQARRKANRKKRKAEEAAARET